PLPSPHIQPASSLLLPPLPLPPPASLLPLPSPPSLSLLARSGIPLPSPDDPFSLRTLSSLLSHTSPRLLSGITSLPPPSRIRLAPTSLLSLPLFQDTLAPIRLLLCTAPLSLLPAPPPRSLPARTPSCSTLLLLSVCSSLLLSPPLLLPTSHTSYSPSA